MLAPRAARLLLVAVMATASSLALTGTGLAQSPPAVLGGSPAGAPTVTDANGNPVTIKDASRVVSLGGVITEIVYALGAQDQLVGVDASSFYPPDALKDKTNVGYGRILSAEPVINANPSLIIGTTETGPPDVLSQIEATGVTTLILPAATSVDAAKARITTIGQALGREAEASQLVSTLDADLADAQALVAKATSSPRAMFVLVAGPTTVLVSGTGTEADTMIGLAGATNAVTAYPGYAPLTAEAAADAAPDIILTMQSGLDALGVPGMLTLPGLAQTPAGAAGKIVGMDDLYLLGMGPRTGKAVADLARLLHPELATP